MRAEMNFHSEKVTLLSYNFAKKLRTNMDKKEVEKIGRLSRLKLTPDEVDFIQIIYQ